MLIDCYQGLNADCQPIKFDPKSPKTLFFFLRIDVERLFELSFSVTEKSVVPWSASCRLNLSPLFAKWMCLLHMGFLRYIHALLALFHNAWFAWSHSLFLIGLRYEELELQVKTSTRRCDIFEIITLNFKIKELNHVPKLGLNESSPTTQKSSARYFLASCCKLSHGLLAKVVCNRCIRSTPSKSWLPRGYKRSYWYILQQPIRPIHLSLFFILLWII